MRGGRRSPKRRSGKSTSRQYFCFPLNQCISTVKFRLLLLSKLVSVRPMQRGFFLLRLLRLLRLLLLLSLR